MAKAMAPVLPHANPGALLLDNGGMTVCTTTVVLLVLPLFVAEIMLGGAVAQLIDVLLVVMPTAVWSALVRALVLGALVLVLVVMVALKSLVVPLPVNSVAVLVEFPRLPGTGSVVFVADLHMSSKYAVVVVWSADGHELLEQVRVALEKNLLAHRHDASVKSDLHPTAFAAVVAHRRAQAGRLPANWAFATGELDNIPRAKIVRSSSTRSTTIWAKLRTLSLSVHLGIGNSYIVL